MADPIDILAAGDGRWSEATRGFAHGAWVAHHHSRRWLTRDDLGQRGEELALQPSSTGKGSPRAPLYSLLLVGAAPTAAPSPRLVASLRGQIDPRWELLFCRTSEVESIASEADDGEPSLADLVLVDPRVVPIAGTTARTTAGMANILLAAARGEFVAVVGDEDELDFELLVRVDRLLTADPTLDVVYSDEEWLDRTGRRVALRLKPGWSPDLLSSTSYLGRLMLVRRSLALAAGGFREEAGAAQEFDLALRVTERTGRIERVAHSLLRRRGIDAGADLATLSAERAALTAALERRGEMGDVVPGLVAGTHRVRREQVTSPLVSVIVPYRDGGAELAVAIEALLSRGGYDRLEVLLIDNQSWEPETEPWIRHVLRDPRCRRLAYPGEFNWSAINDWAVERAKGDVLLFLNADTEGVSDGWVSAMLEHVQRPDVGAVGAHLRYPDGTTQHAGVAMLRERPGDPFSPTPLRGLYGFEGCIRECLAVTGACLMVRSVVFREIGGFDPLLGWNFNDVDFCLRLVAAGYRVVYTPYAELQHNEGLTRGRTGDRGSAWLITWRWGRRFEADPYLHPELAAQPILWNDMASRVEIAEAGQSDAREDRPDEFEHAVPQGAAPAGGRPRSGGRAPLRGRGAAAPQSLVERPTGPSGTADRRSVAPTPDSSGASDRVPSAGTLSHPAAAISRDDGALLERDGSPRGSRGRAATRDRGAPRGAGEDRESRSTGECRGNRPGGGWLERARVWFRGGGARTTEHERGDGADAPHRSGAGELSRMNGDD